MRTEHRHSRAFAPDRHNFHPHYRPDIDGLRAVAILAVVIFHAFPKTLHGGFVGVDVFFVISGYLISSIIFRSLDQGDFSFFEFYGNRIRRIFPALIVVLLSSVFLGWFALMPDELAQLGKHMAGGAGFMQNFLLWSEAGYFDNRSELKPLMHLWSLAIEEQFYLVYPLCLWVLWKSRASLSSWLLALFVVSLGLNVSKVGGDPIGTFFLPHTRFWELLAGGLLACNPTFFRRGLASLFERFNAHHAALVNHLISILGIMLIVAASVWLNKGRSFPGWWALMPVAGSVLLILAGPDALINRFVLSSRMMIFVGLISYPLYLWHWPILSFARILDSDEPSSWIRVALLCLSALLAWLTWRFVERPLRFGAKTFGRVSLLCMLVIGLGVAGYSINEQSGVSQRFSQDKYSAFRWVKGENNRTFCRAVFQDAGYPESCLLSAGTQPHIALIGDSHSGHLYPGLANQGLNVLNLGKGGCLPFYDVGFGSQGSECRLGYMNKVLDLAVEDPRIRLIALSARYAAALEGGEYDLRKPDRTGAMELFSSAGQGQGNAEVFRRALDKTLSKLVGSGKTIAIILDVPELGFNPRSCVRPVTLFTSNRVPCAIPLEAYEKRSGRYRQIMTSVLQAYPSVRVFDAPALFCDAAYCWAEKAGQMLYRDDDHLSLQGSDFVAQRLARWLESAQP